MTAPTYRMDPTTLDAIRTAVSQWQREEQLGQQVEEVFREMREERRS
jgi:hypothetical protein